MKLDRKGPTGARLVPGVAAGPDRKGLSGQDKPTLKQGLRHPTARRTQVSRCGRDAPNLWPTKAPKMERRAVPVRTDQVGCRLRHHLEQNLDRPRLGGLGTTFGQQGHGGTGLRRPLGREYYRHRPKARHGRQQTPQQGPWHPLRYKAEPFAGSRHHRLPGECRGRSHQSWP